MPDKEIRVLWSDDAKADLNVIYNHVKSYTQSAESAKNVVKDILNKTKTITYAGQYQVDEFLGLPFRRMVVRNYKIIYTLKEPLEIRILQIFDARQNPDKMRDGR